MADTPIIPMGDDPQASAEASRNVPDSPKRTEASRLWQRGASLSSSPQGIAARVNGFLMQAGFDRAPWLAVVFAGGILAWFGLDNPWQWTAAMVASALIALAGFVVWPSSDSEDDTRSFLRGAVMVCALTFAAGIAVIWLRSETVGAQPIDRPMVERVQGYVLEREDQPSEGRIRLTLAVRDAVNGESRKIRINIPLEEVVRVDTETRQSGTAEALREGTIVRLRVRLVPPASPMLPGSYDFARAAWFKGLAATGSLVGQIEIVEPSRGTQLLAGWRRSLSEHVQARLAGPTGAIAAAFASGDRGAISTSDAEAMRDAGLTHLLAISGLHVSAVIAAAYFVALKCLALFPALALRIRLPIVAAGAGALAGIGYTLLTGAQVPTVRACVAALLVLGALVIGREALSLRMVAVAAFVVLLLWPESVVGPSFQMSFSAVLAIVALHTSAPVRAFLSARDESWAKCMARHLLILFLTGLVIEIALMPIVMFHFHRAGVYGALANLVAIPLVTFVSMPLTALALALDIVGLGGPIWRLAGLSLEALLGVARFTSGQPGAVKLMPQMSGVTVGLFVAGGLWLTLWNQRSRFWGLLPITFASVTMLSTPIPDVLIGREGRHVGITLDDGSLLTLRNTRSSYVLENLLELAGVKSEPIPLEEYEAAICSREFCVVTIDRGAREWTLLLARNNELIEERALAAACERADIVVAARYLPYSCRPRWLKADKRYLDRKGGVAVNLEHGSITTVSDGQGAHGWWIGEGGAAKR